MKSKIILSGLLSIIIIAGISANAGAAPWRGYRHGGFYGPRVGVRICPPVPVFIPPAPVVVGGYYGGGYGGGYYRGGGACRPHYYAAAPRYYGHGYEGYRGGYGGYRGGGYRGHRR